MLGAVQCLGPELGPEVDHNHGEEEDDETDRDGRGAGGATELWRCERSSLLNDNVALGLGTSLALDDPGRPLWLKLVLTVRLLLTVISAALTIVVLTVLVITNILSTATSRPGALAVAVLVVVTVVAQFSAAVVSRVVGIF